MMGDEAEQQERCHEPAHWPREELTAVAQADRTEGTIGAGCSVSEDGRLREA